MAKRRALTLVAFFFAISSVWSNSDAARAQSATPSLPSAPQPTPGYPGGPRLPFGAQGGSGNYAISATANEHGAFLWVVDNVQHAVMLCEKIDTRDFTCTKKQLP